MILSGFLMMHNWKAPSVGEWRGRDTLRFYTARFFRIAPLYYAMLILCHFVLADLSEMVRSNEKAYPSEWIASVGSRVEKWDFSSLKGIFLHGTFLFGLVPGMESSSPLPGWSLSLEMQFYMMFPLLIGLLKPALVLPAGLTMAGLSYMVPRLLGHYLEPGLLAHFGLPSPLVYRCNVFFAGMLLACLLRPGENGQDSKWRALALGSALLCLLPMNRVGMLLCILFGLLIFSRVPWISAFLGCKFMRFFGTVSYSIYLVHNPIIIPLVFWLTGAFQLQDWPEMKRLGLVLGFTLPCVLGASYVLYRWVELPGIQLGRKILKSSFFADSRPRMT